ncbi:S1C family serine protease [Candidatus Pelagibacter bacterium]|nr:S1C family serine protease [Candidatus Pelagibacter bacterium]
MKKLLMIIVLGLLFSGNAYAGYKPKVKEKNKNGIVLSILGPVIKDSSAKWLNALNKTNSIAIKHCNLFGKNTYVFWSNMSGTFARNTSGNLLSWRSYSIESKYHALGFIQEYDDDRAPIKFRYFCANDQKQAFTILDDYYLYFNKDFFTNLKNITNPYYSQINTKPYKFIKIFTEETKVAKIIKEKNKSKKNKKENIKIQSDSIPGNSLWKFGGSNHYVVFIEQKCKFFYSKYNDIRAEITALDRLKRNRWSPAVCDIVDKDDYLEIKFGQKTKFNYEGPDIDKWYYIKFLDEEAIGNNQSAGLDSFKRVTKRKSPRILAKRIKLEHPSLRAKLNNEKKIIVKEKKPKPETKKPEVVVKKPELKRIPAKTNDVDGSLLTIGSGSGFFINNKGYALTNNHVVDICAQSVAVVDGRETLFRVIATDKTNDVAVLKTDYKSRNYIKINEDGAKLGENVIAVGYPLAGRLSDSVKITRGIVSSTSGLNNNIGQIQIDAALQPGNSGGPVLNENGDLVGIASAGLNKLLMAKEAKYIPENVNFAVASPIVVNILKSKKVKYTTPSMFGRSYSNTELAELGDRSTIQLFCRNTRTAYNRLKSSNKYSTVLLDLD